MTRIGANAWIWSSPITDDVIADLVPRVAGLGFDLIELPVETPGHWDPGRAADLLAEHDVGASVCCVMPPGRDLSVRDADVVVGTQAYLSRCVEIAERLGSPVVAGPMYAAVGRLWRMDGDERRRTIERIARALRPVSELAAQRGVTLAVEPLNRYETSVLNTVEQGMELLEAVGHPACGLLLDTYHMNIEEKSPSAAVRFAAGRIAHVHACGTDRGTPGADSFDWPSFLLALAESGYDGPLCIESFTSENDAVATAASIWRPLASSPDELAGDGLGFLRAQLAPSD